MIDPVGRHQRFFALIVNAMVDSFGEVGSASIFAAAGLVLAGFTIRGGLVRQ